MEDYSFEEMQNINQNIILAVEEDEEFIINNILNKDIVLMPLRFSYDLSNFSEDYINKTKMLFIYYANKDNPRFNELLRLKKHFKHYMRTPKVAYVPNKEEYMFIKSILEEIGIPVYDDLSEALNNL